MTPQELYDTLCYIQGKIEPLLRAWPGSQVIEIVMQGDLLSYVYDNERHIHSSLPAVIE